MTGALFLPAVTPEVLAWVTTILAAMGGMVLHAAYPPADEALAEALLLAAVHP